MSVLMCFSLLTTPAFAAEPDVTATPSATATPAPEPTAEPLPTSSVPPATAEPSPVPTIPVTTPEPSPMPSAPVAEVTPTPTATPGASVDISRLSLPPDTKPLQVTGGAQGVDYTYDANTLTFTQSGNYTVSMAPGVTTTTDHIASAAAVELTLTLNGVVIDVSESANTSAIDFNSAGACTLVLAAGSVN
ncbi:MAG: hypothetical protein PHG73_09870, partial [Pygmaiobacter sp.]|nr:hypothetical protein [Pygmaiobacter sp.]